MKFDIKTISVIVGLVLTVSGVVYTSITTVNSKVTQINTNTVDIQELTDSVKLDKLCELHRKALSDYYYWDAECKRTGNINACKNADEAKRRVDRIEQQLQELEKKTGEICG